MGERVDNLEKEIEAIKNHLNNVVRALNDNQIHIKIRLGEIGEEIEEEETEEEETKLPNIPEVPDIPDSEDKE